MKPKAIRAEPHRLLGDTGPLQPSHPSAAFLSPGSTFFTGETWAWNWMDLLIVFSAIAETVVQVKTADPQTGCRAVSSRVRP